MPADDIRKYLRIVSEATLPPHLSSLTFYHGTWNRDVAEAIRVNGIQPDQSTVYRGSLQPMTGHVYLTTSLGTAASYAAGKPSTRKPHPIGYIFEVPGEALTGQVSPDEDEVGHFMYRHGVFDHDRNKTTTKMYQSRGETLTYNDYVFMPQAGDSAGAEDIWDFIRPTIPEETFQRIMRGEEVAMARVGKKALKCMPDWMKLALIQTGSEVAHAGAVRPSRIWTFSKLDRTKLGIDRGIESILTEVPLNAPLP